MKITQILAIVTLASLPLYAARCSSFSWCVSPVPFTLLEVLIFASFISWAIWRLCQVKSGIISAHRLFERLRGPFFWPLVIFLLASTLAVFVSPDLKAAAGVWKAYFIEPALLFIVVLDISLVKRSVNWIIYPLLFSGFWLASLAGWQAFSKVDPFAPNSIAVGRVTGVYDNPNALGLYLGPLVLIGLGLAIGILKKKQIPFRKLTQSAIILGVLAVFLLAIYLSKSRGAGLGLGVSFVFFISLVVYTKLPTIFRKFSQRAFYIIILLFLAALLFGFVNINKFVPASPPQIEGTGYTRDTAYTRLCIWQGTKSMLAENKFTGVGLSGFPSVYPSFSTCEPYHFQYPHNIFLNFWSELGIIGLLAFFWIIYKYWKILSEHLNDFVAIGLISAVAYIFVHGLVDVPYFKNDLSSQFWVFLAIAAWFGGSRSSKTKKVQRRHPSAKV